MRRRPWLAGDDTDDSDPDESNDDEFDEDEEDVLPSDAGNSSSAAKSASTTTTAAAAVMPSEGLSAPAQGAQIAAMDGRGNEQSAAAANALIDAAAAATTTAAARVDEGRHDTTASAGMAEASGLPDQPASEFAASDPSVAASSSSSSSSSTDHSAPGNSSSNGSNSNNQVGNAEAASAMDEALAVTEPAVEATLAAEQSAAAQSAGGQGEAVGELALRFKHLKEQFERGELTRDEYKHARTSLVDSLTGTTSAGSKKTPGVTSAVVKPGQAPLAVVPNRQRSRRPQLQDSVTDNDYKGGPRRALPRHLLPQEPANLEEKAVKHIFVASTRSWLSLPTRVKVQRELLGKHGERKAFHLQEVGPGRDVASVNYVAKICLDSDAARQLLFRWVEDQMYAREWANKFNEFQPPKKVTFVDAWLLELVDRSDKPICAVEQFLSGSFQKHNDKEGRPTVQDRNTPQAFSHFSYVASDSKLLICNIKGVGDTYTDPRICLASHAYLPQQGAGEASAPAAAALELEIAADERTIANFIESHRCNPICVYLKLPIMNGPPTTEADAQSAAADNQAARSRAGSSRGTKQRRRGRRNSDAARQIVAGRDEMRDAGKTIPAVTYMPRESVNMMRALHSPSLATSAAASSTVTRAPGGLPFLLQCCSIL
ncbi:hypothetical protein CAOG_01104 [Capsaspora owczarzaki ATCC 30864]|uniref:Alpha-type protein kinase domain-containing protein n=1 Tax=Capsaspora owczarzaki (strain ATCC 30864) TaxID=595528 RepID=A0A0D2X0U5_CAPO3|nr:hypothetical protein CAOG_01104 [Capsaspora owczarzaki ATCC 30864]KJE89669.1 hypothetical protein CAOG_001104 [Capsaspora owczarzaki ATCC 30864]|eukprot:XP_004365975.2 hypothetical protein CAOG_01104 [Capsaspora owczarzaki ATCC 30864]